MYIKNSGDGSSAENACEYHWIIASNDNIDMEDL